MTKQFKKKILAISPILPQPEDIKKFSKALKFFIPEYKIIFFDSLAEIKREMTKEAFYQNWLDTLKKEISNYDIFFGFSFGGVILQQCLKLFEQNQKLIILFSTPSFIDQFLEEKLKHVVNLLDGDHVHAAVEYLNKHVFYPNKPPLLNVESFNISQAKSRLLLGFKLILTTDSRPVLLNTIVKHIHLIGKESCLVNQYNVIKSPHGNLISIPNSGMRILEDNLPYCSKIVRRYLKNEVA